MGFECATFRVDFISSEASLEMFLRNYEGAVDSSAVTGLSGTYVLEDEHAIIEMSLHVNGLSVHVALTNPAEVLALLRSFLYAMAGESPVVIDSDGHRGSDIDAFMTVFAESFASERVEFERHLGGVALGEGYKSTMDDARSLFFQVHANTRAGDESE